MFAVLISSSYLPICFFFLVSFSLPVIHIDVFAYHLYSFLVVLFSVGKQFSLRQEYRCISTDSMLFRGIETFEQNKNKLWLEVLSGGWSIVCID